MGWSKWVRSNTYGECLLSTNNDGTWIHHLVAHPDEENPNANHVHLKTKLGGKTPILASVKSDGKHSVNRRELIEKINRTCDMNIPYK